MSNPRPFDALYDLYRNALDPFRRKVLDPNAPGASPENPLRLDPLVVTPDEGPLDEKAREQEAIARFGGTFGGEHPLKTALRGIVERQEHTPAPLVAPDSDAQRHADEERNLLNMGERIQQGADEMSKAVRGRPAPQPSDFAQHGIDPRVQLTANRHRAEATAEAAARFRRALHGDSPLPGDDTPLLGMEDRQRLGEYLTRDPILPHGVYTGGQGMDTTQDYTPEEYAADRRQAKYEHTPSLARLPMNFTEGAARGVPFVGHKLAAVPAYLVQRLAGGDASLDEVGQQMGELDRSTADRLAEIGGQFYTYGKLLHGATAGLGALGVGAGVSPLGALGLAHVAQGAVDASMPAEDWTQRAKNIAIGQAVTLPFSALGAAGIVGEGRAARAASLRERAQRTADALREHQTRRIRFNQRMDEQLGVAAPRPEPAPTRPDTNVFGVEPGTTRLPLTEAQRYGTDPLMRRSEQQRATSARTVRGPDDLRAPELDLSPEARLGRAREQGFDTDTQLYTGLRSGTTEPVELHDGVTWLTEDPKKADYYAMGGDGRSTDPMMNNTHRSGQQVVPTYVRGRIADLTRGAWQDGAFTGADGIRRQGRYVPPDGQDSVIQELFQRLSKDGPLPRPRNVTPETWTPERQVEELRVWLHAPLLAAVGGSRAFESRVLNTLREMGYDGMRINFPNGSATQVAVFDPANIRSTFARFDPENAGRTGLAYSNPGADPEVWKRALSTPVGRAAAGAAAGGVAGGAATDSDEGAFAGAVAGASLALSPEFATGLRRMAHGAPEATIPRPEVRDFQPDERVVGAAIWVPSGKVYLGPNHGIAEDLAREAGEDVAQGYPGFYTSAKRLISKRESDALTGLSESLQMRRAGVMRRGAVNLAGEVAPVEGRLSDLLRTPGERPGASGTLARITSTLRNEEGAVGPREPDQPIRRRDLPASMRVMPANLNAGETRAWLHGETTAKNGLARDLNPFEPDTPEWTRWEQGWRSQQPRQRGAEFGLNQTPRESHPDERITHASYLHPDGRVFRGTIHADAEWNAQQQGWQGEEMEPGFSTTHRPFITRAEARPIAERQGIVRTDEQLGYTPTPAQRQVLGTEDLRVGLMRADEQLAPSALDRLAEPVRNERGAVGDLSRQISSDEPIEAAAKEAFGTTADPREAGFILPDGEMLDFSGRRHGSRYSGQRGLDHRAITDAYPEDLSGSGDAHLDDFRMRGNVRVSVEGSPRGGYSVNVDFAKPLTPQQHRTLMDLAALGGEFNAEVRGANGRTLAHGTLPVSDVRSASGLLRRLLQEANASRGASNIAPLTSIVGGGAGAAYGYTQGDTQEERALNALAYGAGGAVAGGLLPRALVSAARHAGNEIGAFNPGGRGLERFPDGELRLMAQRLDGDPAQEAILAELRSRDASLQQHMGAVDEVQGDAARGDIQSRKPEFRRYYAEPLTGGKWRVLDGETGDVVEPGIGGFDGQRRANDIAARLNREAGANGPGDAAPEPSAASGEASIGDSREFMHDARAYADAHQNELLDGVRQDAKARVEASMDELAAAESEVVRLAGSAELRADLKNHINRVVDHTVELVRARRAPPESLTAETLSARARLPEAVEVWTGGRADYERAARRYMRAVLESRYAENNYRAVSLRADQGAAPGVAVRAIGGASAGAIVGAATDDEDRARGAAVGAVAGLGVGLAPEVLASVRRVAGNDVGAVGDIGALSEPERALGDAIQQARERHYQSIVAGLETAHPTNLRTADGRWNHLVLTQAERDALHAAEGDLSLGGKAHPRDVTALLSGEKSPAAFAHAYGVPRRVVNRYMRELKHFNAEVPGYVSPLDAPENAHARPEPEAPDFDFQTPPEPRPMDAPMDEGDRLRSAIPDPVRTFGSGNGQTGMRLLSPEGLAAQTRAIQLTNVVGRFRDFLDNVLMMAPAETASSALAAGFDTLVDLLPGMHGQRTNAFNLGAAATAAKKGATEGMMDMGRAIVGRPRRARAGQASADAAARATEGMSPEGGTDAHVERVQMHNPILDAHVRITGRITGAVDAPAAVYAYERSIGEQAKVVALNERYHKALPAGVSFKQRIVDLTKTPTPEMQVLAAEAVQHATFTNDSVVSKLVNGIRDAVQEHPWAKGGLDFFVTRWRRTPGATVGKQFEYSPLGAAKALNDALRLYQLSTGRSGRLVASATGAAIGGGLGAASDPEHRGRNALIGAVLGGTGGAMAADVNLRVGTGSKATARRAMNMTAGRAVTGTSIMAVGALLASEGRMAGLSLSDEDRRNGAKPLSILIGGRWWPVGMFPPTGIALATGAELYHHGSRQALTGFLGKTGESAFLRSVSDIREATRNDQGQVRLAQTAATAFVPPIVSQMEQVVDPTERKPEGGLVDSTIQSVESRVPGLSANVPARMDEFGQPQRETSSTPARIAFALLDPTHSTPDRRGQDPTRDWLSSAGVNVGAVKRMEAETPEQLALRLSKQPEAPGYTDDTEQSYARRAARWNRPRRQETEAQYRARQMEVGLQERRVLTALRSRSQPSDEKLISDWEQFHEMPSIVREQNPSLHGEQLQQAVRGRQQEIIRRVMNRARQEVALRRGDDPSMYATPDN
jgi:hypothetical protein